MRRTITYVVRFARLERSQLCDTLERAGPDHPTLCAGWTAYDLTAHLVLRERRADAAPGLAVRVLAGRTADVQNRIKSRHSYQQLISMIRDGPPRWSPVRLSMVDELVNTVEFFVHHEDLRRAAPGWQPRKLVAGFEDLLWERLRRGGRLFFRRSPVGVRLRHAVSGDTITARTGEPAVMLTGPPGELMVYAFNRKRHALVAEAGDSEATARLHAAQLGV
jgi:uncharacterized protein (TIGR03085 family)